MPYEVTISGGAPWGFRLSGGAPSEEGIRVRYVLLEHLELSKQYIDSKKFFCAKK